MPTDGRARARARAEPEQKFRQNLGSRDPREETEMGEEGKFLPHEGLIKDSEDRGGGLCREQWGGGSQGRKGQPHR